MHILLDQNLSFRLLRHIAAEFPAATHVKTLGLIDADDLEIFRFARQQKIAAILTQDEDFYKILLELGQPPKVIWLRTGNCSTAAVAEIVSTNADLIRQFLGDAELDCLEIYGR